MITDCFNEVAILNMSIALERACRDIPIKMQKHEDRLFVAQRILAYAHSGHTKLDDLTAVGRQAVDELLSDSNKAA